MLLQKLQRQLRDHRPTVLRSILFQTIPFRVASDRSPSEVLFITYYTIAIVCHLLACKGFQSASLYPSTYIVLALSAVHMYMYDVSMDVRIVRTYIHTYVSNIVLIFSVNGKAYASYRFTRRGFTTVVLPSAISIFDSCYAIASARVYCTERLYTCAI